MIHSHKKPTSWMFGWTPPWHRKELNNDQRSSKFSRHSLHNVQEQSNNDGNLLFYNRSSNQDGDSLTHPISDNAMDTGYASPPLSSSNSSTTSASRRNTKSSVLDFFHRRKSSSPSIASSSITPQQSTPIARKATLPTVATAPPPNAYQPVATSAALNTLSTGPVLPLSNTNNCHTASIHMSNVPTTIASTTVSSCADSMANSVLPSSSISQPSSPMKPSPPAHPAINTNTTTTTTTTTTTVTNTNTAASASTTLLSPSPTSIPSTSHLPAALPQPQRQPQRQPQPQQPHQRPHRFPFIHTQNEIIPEADRYYRHTQSTSSSSSSPPQQQQQQQLQQQQQPSLRPSSIYTVSSSSHSKNHRHRHHYQTQPPACLTKSDDQFDVNLGIDENEMPGMEDTKRITLRHELVRLALDGLFKSPLEPNGEERQVLQIGCGDGSWCVDCAKSNPTWFVLGLDDKHGGPLISAASGKKMMMSGTSSSLSASVPLASTIISAATTAGTVSATTSSTGPSGASGTGNNFYFIKSSTSLVDSLKKIPDGQFDLVYGRFLALELSPGEYEELVSECWRVCKASGFVEFTELDMRIYCNPGAGTLVNWLNQQVVWAMTKKKLDARLPRHLQDLFFKLLVEDQPASSRQRQNSYHVKYNSLPLGVWGGRLGVMFRDDIHDVLDALNVGTTTDRYGNALTEEEWQATADTLDDELETQMAFMNLYQIYAQKNKP